MICKVSGFKDQNKFGKFGYLESFINSLTD
jgi:hypothetical protein